MRLTKYSLQEERTKGTVWSALRLPLNAAFRLGGTSFSTAEMFVVSVFLEWVVHLGDSRLRRVLFFSLHRTDRLFSYLNKIYFVGLAKNSLRFAPCNISENLSR